MQPEVGSTLAPPADAATERQAPPSRSGNHCTKSTGWAVRSCHPERDPGCDPPRGSPWRRTHSIDDRPGGEPQPPVLATPANEENGQGRAVREAGRTGRHATMEGPPSVVQRRVVQRPRGLRLASAWSCKCGSGGAVPFSLTRPKQSRTLLQPQRTGQGPFYFPTSFPVNSDTPTPVRCRSSRGRWA